MSISLNKYFSFLNESKFNFEIENLELLPISDEHNLLFGNINFESPVIFPNYDIDSDSINSNSNSKYQFISFQITSQGEVSFADETGDGNYGTYYLYSHHELNELISMMQLYDGSNTNLNTITFRDFQLDNVLDIFIYIPDIWNDKLVEINQFSNILPASMIKELFQLLSFDYYFIDDEELFFKEYTFTYNLFIKEFENFIDSNDINNKIIFTPISEVQILLDENLASTICDDFIDFRIKLGIKTKGKFSIQYLLTYFHTVDGEFLINEINKCLLSKISFGNLKIKAPKDYYLQIIYSIAIRYQIKAYQEVSKNLAKVNIRDVKDFYKSRRLIVKDFIINKNNFKFLDTLSNPLPYNIEKCYRSYLRSAEELDKLTFGSKLYNLVLKSIVLYPLEELIYLGFDKNHEIIDILAVIKNNKAVSDGTWIELFSILVKFVSKRNEIKLEFFGSFIFEANKKIVPILKNLIPSRNEVHHYREHYGTWLKILDSNLPEILDFLRIHLSGILLLKILNQNFKKDGLYIKAKKIMGYEVDIETIEFKTHLDGKHFIQDELIFYKNNSNYSIPLNNFFTMEFIKIDAIKMGIISKYQDGVPQFEY
jgi:hypothetical protein